MIFQEPRTALNPVFTIGDQIAETVRRHQGLDRGIARRRTVEVLRAVGIADAETRVNDFPHQLSGGMLQRAMIAMALACKPKLIIADEPTTALDVTVQAQILDLLRNLTLSTGTAIILITHNMGVVAAMADRVLVMYAGRGIEHGTVHDVLLNPQHPYTKGLLACLPPDVTSVAARNPLSEIPWASSILRGTGPWLPIRTTVPVLCGTLRNGSPNQLSGGAWATIPRASSCRRRGHERAAARDQGPGRSFSHSGTITARES